MGLISDEFWAVVQDALPQDSCRSGRPWNDHRLMLEGIAYRYRVGTPWRDLPADFGAWQTVWKRHRRWSFDGTYEKIFQLACSHFAADRVGDVESVDRVMEMLSVDSTVVRAHQHAAGARKTADAEVISPSSEHTGGTVELQEISH